MGKGDYLKNPFTSEIVPKKISNLVELRENLKMAEKQLAKSLNEVDEALMSLLQEEGSEEFKLTETKSVKIVRSSKKIWDMKKVYELVGENKQVKEIDKTTGEIKYVDLFTPVDRALKLFMGERMLGKKYEQCFYTKPIKPFIKIEDFKSKS